MMALKIKPSRSNSSKSNFNNMVVLPLFTKISQQISEVLKKFNIKTLFVPVNKINFSNLKDPIDIFISKGIYRISCQCYIGETKRALKFCPKEHENYVKIRV